MLAAEAGVVAVRAGRRNTLVSRRRRHQSLGLDELLQARQRPRGITSCHNIVKYTIQSVACDMCVSLEIQPVFHLNSFEFLLLRFNVYEHLCSPIHDTVHIRCWQDRVVTVDIVLCRRHHSSNSSSSSSATASLLLCPALPRPNRRGH